MALAAGDGRPLHDVEQTLALRVDVCRRRG
jgi:hypothetical protein